MLNELLSKGILRLRYANSSDIEQILELVNRSYRGESSRVGWTTEADLLDGQRTDHPMLESLLNQSNNFIFLIECQAHLLHQDISDDSLITILKQIVGPDKSKKILVACAHLELTEMGLYFGMLSVHPCIQSFGLGRFCIEQFKALAKSKDASRVWMTVIEQRQDLIAYYERRGFIRTGFVHPFPNHDPRYGISKVGDLKLIEMDQKISKYQ